MVDRRGGGSLRHRRHLCGIGREIGLFRHRGKEGGSRRGRGREREMKRKKEEKPRVPPIPQVLSWFIGELPAASSFDRQFSFFPLFAYLLLLLCWSRSCIPEDLMNLFRNAIIPSSSTLRGGQFFT